ncbi:predicted protein [Histoplasma capsulatum H143]|uniref:Uncharacterized protein n=1 Tax=Ajellomyces capsulatus (strain H143) TaxID=544712 RepID=C6HSG4_AJECH|nr:predicted protein [Histoplasma capsulatum H143]
MAPMFAVEARSVLGSTQGQPTMLLRFLALIPTVAPTRQCLQTISGSQMETHESTSFFEDGGAGDRGKPSKGQKGPERRALALTLTASRSSVLFHPRHRRSLRNCDDDGQLRTEENLEIIAHETTV